MRLKDKVVIITGASTGIGRADALLFAKEGAKIAIGDKIEKKRTFGDIEKDLFSHMHVAGYEPMTPQIHVYNNSMHMPMASPAQPGDYFVVHPNVRNKDFTAAAKFGNTVHITRDWKVESLQTIPAKLNVVML